MSAEKKISGNGLMESLEFEITHPLNPNAPKDSPEKQAVRFEVEHAREKGPTPEQAAALLEKQGLLKNGEGLQRLMRAIN